MENLIAKIKEFIQKLNESGVPLPMVKIDGKPTFTGTMTFISFNTALLGQLGKVSHILGDVDLTQANYLFMICLGAYLGRKMQKNSKGDVSIAGEKEGANELPKELQP